MPQGSSLIFNIFINDIFYFITNCLLCNYADDNTLYAFDRSHEIMKCKLQKDFNTLIWMCSSRSSNSNINMIHERYLRICKNNYDISFETLLNECNEVTIHVKKPSHSFNRGLYILTDSHHQLCKSFFETRTLNYNLRSFRAIQTYRKNTIAFGIETVTYKSSQLWQILPTELKSIRQNIYQKFRIFRININVHVLMHFFCFVSGHHQLSSDSGTTVVTWVVQFYQGVTFIC